MSALAGREVLDAAQQFLEDVRHLVDGLSDDALTGPAGPARLLDEAVPARQPQVPLHLGQPAPSAAPGQARSSVASPRGDVTRSELWIRVTSPQGASSPECRRRAVMCAAMTVQPPVMTAPMMAPMKAYIIPLAQWRRVASGETIASLRRYFKMASMQVRGFLVQDCVRRMPDNPRRILRRFRTGIRAENVQLSTAAGQPSGNAYPPSTAPAPALYEVSARPPGTFRGLSPVEVSNRRGMLHAVGGVRSLR